MNWKKWLKFLLKIVVISIVFIFVIKEFSTLISSFSIEDFNRYKDRLTIPRLLIVGALGIISYLPLSLYDFILKDRAKINLNNKKLYEYSWISSSISSLLGLGGAISLALKQYFYKDYVRDRKKLLKEIGKIIFLNLSGLSVICIIFLILNYQYFYSLGNYKYLIIMLSLYGPATISIYVFLYTKNKDKGELNSTLFYILISAVEWITTFTLIYGTLLVMGVRIAMSMVFNVYVKSAAIGVVSMIPGGVGTFDLSFLLSFKALGVPLEQSTVVLILYRISYYMVPAVIGIILFIKTLMGKIRGKWGGR